VVVKIATRPSLDPGPSGVLSSPLKVIKVFRACGIGWGVTTAMVEFWQAQSILALGVHFPPHIGLGFCPVLFLVDRYHVALPDDSNSIIIHEENNASLR
jgi:hypothetical protein